MKHLILVIGLLLVGCAAPTDTPTGSARIADPSEATWQSLGSFTDNSEWTQPQIRVYDNNGTAIPYIAYANADTGNLYVKKYVDGNWESVGATIACNITAACEFDFFVYDNAGTPVPYIAYNNADGDNFYGLIVQKYDGSNWVTVGTGTTVQNAWYPALYVTNNTPYLAYTNYGGDNDVHVISYDGVWNAIGSGAGLDYVTPSSLYVITENEIYLNTNDGNHSMEYSGSNWVQGAPYSNIDASVTATIDAEFAPEQAILQSVAMFGTVIYLAFVNPDTHEIMTYKYE